MGGDEEEVVEWGEKWTGWVVLIHVSELSGMEEPHGKTVGGWGGVKM